MVNKSLELSDLLEKATSYKSQPSVYFLLDKGAVVYVGKSAVPYARIVAHELEKDFESYHIEPCELDDMDNLELHYIVKFSPKYNATLPPNDRYKSIGALKRLTGLNAWQLKKVIKERHIKSVMGMYYDLEFFGELLLNE